MKMIVNEYFNTRPDGVKLYRTYSDADMMIQKDGTDEIYSEAIDVENNGFTYSETDIPIEQDDRDATLDDAMDMLGELGVNVDES